MAFKWSRNEHTISVGAGKGRIPPIFYVGIAKYGRGGISHKGYRKPTHTQQYVNWVSNHPKNMLLGV